MWLLDYGLGLCKKAPIEFCHDVSCSLTGHYLVNSSREYSYGIFVLMNKFYTVNSLFTSCPATTRVKKATTGSYSSHTRGFLVIYSTMHANYSYKIR